MEKILFVNACVRPESRTAGLARYLLEKMEGQVTELKLGDEDIRTLDLESLNRRNDLIEKKEFSDDMFRYARQFGTVDTVVIAAPYWDMSFPAMVKAYVEAIMVQGLTFHYTEEGIPQGLTNIKKVIYVTTAGGPIGDYNMGFDYIKALFGTFCNVTDVTCHKAEMLDVIGMDVESILQETRDEIDEVYGEKQ